MIKLTLASLFIIHGYINLEREMWINEFISIIGLFLGFFYILKSNGKAPKLIICIALLLIYGIISFIFNGLIENSEANIYDQLRTLPIWYSMGAFFFGFYILFESKKTINKSKYFSVIALFFGGKLSPPSILITSLAMDPNPNFRRSILIAILFVTFMSVIKYFMGDRDGTSTVTLMLLFLLTALFFDKNLFHYLRKKYFYAIILFLFLLFIVFLKFVYLEFGDFYYEGFDYFGEDIDVNSLWRLMFWAKIIGELSIMESIFGIGLGTPLFDPTDSTNYFINNSDIEGGDRSYVLGLHNSFLTVLVRLGPIYFLFVFFIIKKIVHGLICLNDDRSKLLAVSIILMCISAGFNVILESSLYSGIFWALLGFSYRFIREGNNYLHQTSQNFS